MASYKAAVALSISDFLKEISSEHSAYYSAHNLSWLNYSSLMVVLNSANISVTASMGPPAFN